MINKNYRILSFGKYIFTSLLLFQISAVNLSTCNNNDALNKQACRRIKNAYIVSPAQRHAYDCINTPILVTNFEGTIQYMNQAAASMLGYENPEDLLGQDIARAIGTSNSKIFYESVERGLPINNLSDTLKFQITLSNNCRIRLEMNLSFLTDESGDPIGVTISAQDTTSSYIDPLTGLYNRLYFAGENNAFGEDSALVKAINLAKRNGPVSLILIDADDFGNINKIYGHLKGDEVLQAAAKKILETVRETDIVCRWGGEEIAIIAFNTSSEEAGYLAERLLEEFHKLTAGLEVTLSMGITTYSKESDGFPLDSRSIALQMLEESDLGLDFSKKNGKNQYSSFPLPK